MSRSWTVRRRRYEVSAQFGSQVRTIFSTRDAIRQIVKRADLFIGAVLVPGAAAPKLVTRDMVQTMKSGAVVVDIAIDQGGCFEPGGRASVTPDGSGGRACFPSPAAPARRAARSSQLPGRFPVARAARWSRAATSAHRRGTSSGRCATFSKASAAHSRTSRASPRTTRTCARGRRLRRSRARIFGEEALRAWTPVGVAGLWMEGYLHEISALALL